MSKVKPFVKWAGGKRQIINELKNYIPESYNTYYEPFIGGGALFFELAPKNAVINDYNKELINVYECLKDKNSYRALCEELNVHEANNSKEYYYQIRALDRDKENFNNMASYIRAARTIYLNKACFNGLYRVNKKNEFNVPFCKKDRVNTYEEENIETIFNFLNNNNIRLLSGDFENAVKDAQRGDFIYFDPPYDSDTNTFTCYTNSEFGRNEQIRLANVFKDLANRGCYVMLSNHNTELMHELYKDYNIHVVQASRNINSDGKKRGKVEEVIITN